jgi:hypothetical protein
MELNQLLHWAVANTPARDPNAPAANGAALHPSDPLHPDHVPADHLVRDQPAKRSDLTSDMLDAIMGKSDSVVMKEKLATILDQSKDLDERVVAMDDFEMVSCNPWRLS